MEANEITAKKAKKQKGPCEKWKSKEELRGSG